MRQNFYSGGLLQPRLKSIQIFTPHACAAGVKYYCLLLARKLLPDLNIYVSVWCMKNCLLYSSNCWTLFTSSANCHFPFSMPVVYRPHPFCWLASMVFMHSRSNIIGTRDNYVLLELDLVFVSFLCTCVTWINEIVLFSPILAVMH